jgi:hypothetical protein
MVGNIVAISILFYCLLNIIDFGFKLKFCLNISPRHATIGL